MATDKKSDHYHAPQGYTDIDGLARNFTEIDHDPKTKISSNAPLSKEKKEALKKEVEASKQRMITKILAIPAVFCDEAEHRFTLRGDVNRITWHETMLRDPSLSYTELYNVWIIAHKRHEAHTSKKSY